MTALLLLLALPSAAEPRWGKDLPAALAESARTGKPVLLEYFGAWCPPCQQLDKEVFRAGALGALEDRFVFAKLDADRLPKEGPHKRYPATSLPAVWVVGPDGKSLGRHAGYEKKEDFLGFLEAALAGKDLAAAAAERLEKAPHDPEVLSEAYTTALLTGDRGRAGDLRKRLEDAREQWQQAWEFARYQEAYVLLNGPEPDPEAAIRIADAFLEDLPESGLAPGAVQMKAGALRKLDRAAEADALMAGLVERFSKDDSVRWRLLFWSRTHGTLEREARLALEDGWKVQLKSERFLTQAVLWLKDRDRPRAREAARKLKDLKPDNAYYDTLLEELGP